MAIDEASDFEVFTLNYDKSVNGVDGYYVVAKDIDASAWTFKTHTYGNNGTTYPQSKDVGFKGTFDGLGHVIDGMKVGNNGIFGIVTAPTIKNVAFTNVELSGYYGTLFAHQAGRLWSGGVVVKEPEFYDVYV